MMNDIKIYNLDKYVLSDRHGWYGGQAGSKDGILINNEYWIVKYPKNTKSMKSIDVSYTTSPLSEFIGSHIYQILGYDVHKTILGIRNGKLVVACKDFCENIGELREIRTLKNVYNETLEELLNTELQGTGDKHYVDLRELLIHLDNNPILSKVDGIKERFWECAIIDAFIKNNDRNNGNWGLLYKDGNYTLAPIYDNGASFSNKLSDERIDVIYNDKDKMINNSLNSVTVYGLNGHSLNMKSLLDLDNAELRRAIVNVSKNIERNLSKICSFIDSIPSEYNGIVVCRDLRKRFYKDSMVLRFNKLLFPKYLEIQNNDMVLQEINNEIQNENLNDVDYFPFGNDDDNMEI